MRMVKKKARTKFECPDRGRCSTTACNNVTAIAIIISSKWICARRFLISDCLIDIYSTIHLHKAKIYGSNVSTSIPTQRSISNRSAHCHNNAKHPSFVPEDYLHENSIKQSKQWMGESIKDNFSFIDFRIKCRQKFKIASRTKVMEMQSNGHCE